MNLTLSAVDNYLSTISNLFLVLLYPGFAIYNILVAYGYIPPVLSGFYGPVSIVYLLFMAPVLFRYKLFLSRKTGVYLYLSFTFFSLILLISFSNYYLSYSPYVKIAFFQTLETLILILSVFLLGFFIKLNKKMYKIFITFIIVSLVSISLYIVQTSEVFFYAQRVSVDNAADSVSSYQGFARSAMMVAFVPLAMTSKLSRYMIIYIVSICILFFLGARSELVGVIFAAGLLVFFRFEISFFRVLQLLVFLVLIATAVSLAYENFSSNRVFELLNVSDASSWISREELQSIAIDQIKDHPFFGYFAGHIINGGSTGSYSHNLLSVWAGFGIIAFIIYLLLCLIPVVDLSILARKNKDQANKFYLCLISGFFVLLLIIFSKSFFWFVPGFVWGMYLNVKRNI